MGRVKNGITLVGKYAGEALNKVYGAADSALNKTVFPVCDAFGNYALQTFISSPGISEYSKNKITGMLINDSAVVKIAYETGEHPTKDVDWIVILAAALHQNIPVQQFHAMQEQETAITQRLPTSRRASGLPDFCP